MNVERYIASGKLEAYVLGELNEAEEQEVLRMAQEHPEVKEELNALERTQEQLAFDCAINPPDSARAALFSQIGVDEAATNAESSLSTGSDSKALNPPSLKSTEKTTTTRMLPRWVPVGMAAAITWIVLATGAALYFWQQWQQTEEDLQIASAQNVEIAQQYDQVQRTSQSLEKQVDILSDPSVQRIALQGLDIAPDAQAVVYWNSNAQSVFLNSAGLPQPGSNQQYQLWAIVDGKPVSAGVVPVDASDDLLTMEQIANASAFAITLEPLGGSAAPTMEAMYVMGEV